ncbi:RTA1 domain protein, putative [Talaromyces stipitatus ATCC 10500]|uniref:RTA1 domain protein, putative n=1 Tax=Talaromyces stipitatus (strain ATCC 10500 / CBS 375.48 / QM 6759 / NRRL 1006) TaxID=441959 RepID=B8M5Q3_TALSN|nr:RTA1 domain protein, putative [Talaromyces stipitatus ATCC 10500]EED19947.1 RTA1 domain protein, putative [Talaromyces stipitatus ATCC 10500]
MSSPLEIELQNNCHAWDPALYNDTNYGYVPSLAAGIVFTVLFGLSMIAHTVQFIWTRWWWCSVFSVGAMVEVLGWAGRAWSSQCPYMLTPFLMQISTLIIAPAFFTAGIYVILGRLINVLGRSSSILSPALYLWIFCTCDIISLVVQAIGGGMASSEAGKVDGDTKPGTDIMVAGIVFQLASITVFAVCVFDFLRRILKQRLLRTVQGNVTPLLLAMMFSIVLIYIRSIYRVIELVQGWSGYLITHEAYFIALDGSMMVPAVAIFNFVHPGWFMPTRKSVDDFEQVSMNERLVT